MATTNFEMDSDENYHNESEFYYPEDMENYSHKENIGLQHENMQNTQFCKRKNENVFTSLESLRTWAVSKPSDTVFTLEYGPPCW